MSTSEITRSELIRAMVDLGTLVTGPQTLDERLNGLCEMASHMLGCDHVAVMQRQGATYRGKWHYGLTGWLEQRFKAATFPLSAQNQDRIENCDTYLLVNDAREDPILGDAARLVDLQSVVIVPFTHPDGEPLGYLTASYNTKKREITHDEAELSLGLARILQTTLLRHLETTRRKELSQAVLEVADSERRRLSRDIHDDPLQRILGVRIGLEGFRETLSSDDDRAAVGRFIEECRGVSTSLREVMLQTHPNSSELTDLEDVLTAMVRRREFGSDCILRFNDDRTAESPSYLVPVLNRIGEQAARNTFRHANATEVAVQLSDVDGGTLLQITDNGVGFDLSAVPHDRLGLVSMRERTELLGGTFAITSAPSHGTSISAWFPHSEATT